MDDDEDKLDFEERDLLGSLRHGGCCSEVSQALMVRGVLVGLLLRPVDGVERVLSVMVVVIPGGRRLLQFKLTLDDDELW